MNRALLIASQTAGLRGCHADVALMAEVLGEWDFQCAVVTDGTATQAGILDAYRGLIDETAAGDAVVVYYSGHGGRIRNLTPIERHSNDADDERVLAVHRADRLRGVHARRVPRDPRRGAARAPARAEHEDRQRDHDPRLLPRRVDVTRSGVGGPLPATSVCRAAPGRDRPLGAGRRGPPDRARTPRAPSTGTPRATSAQSASSPACRRESAFEAVMPGVESDAVHGLLTEALAGILREARATRRAGDVTWDDVAGPLRSRVLSRAGQQHVLVEGPSRRRLFSSEQVDQARGWPVELADGTVRLPGAAFAGIGPGDTVSLVPGGRRADADGRINARVGRIEAGRAVLELPDRESGELLGPGTVAYPVTFTSPAAQGRRGRRRRTCPRRRPRRHRALPTPRAGGRRDRPVGPGGRRRHRPDAGQSGRHGAVRRAAAGHTGRAGPAHR